ncbi:MAG: anti-sigma factor family protein [Gemmatimonadaceae bacterium]|jgi:anti-sigma factor RsiW
MDCREFCDQHLAFVDDTIAGIELVRMQRHLTECESCAKQDAKIRRALLLFRNLPSIEPSANFSDRLEARLKECQTEQLVHSQRNLRLGAVAATLASVLMLGYIGTTLYGHSETPHDLVMPPVVASIPESELMPASGPAMVTSVSAGLTIWPAALFAEQVPVRFAHSQLELANYTR